MLITPNESRAGRIEIKVGTLVGSQIGLDRQRRLIQYLGLKGICYFYNGL